MLSCDSVTTGVLSCDSVTTGVLSCDSVTTGVLSCDSVTTGVLSCDSVTTGVLLCHHVPPVVVVVPGGGLHVQDSLPDSTQIAQVLGEHRLNLQKGSHNLRAPLTRKVGHLLILSLSHPCKLGLGITHLPHKGTGRGCFLCFKFYLFI